MKFGCFMASVAIGLYLLNMPANADDDLVPVLSADSSEESSSEVTHKQQEIISRSAATNFNLIDQPQAREATNSKPIELLKPALVLLVPNGAINSSFGRAVDPTFVQALRNAINATQLQYKKEDEYVPVSTAQTVARIQNYLAQGVSTKLSECGVASNISGSDIDSSNNQTTGADQDLSSRDYIYRIELGVNRLVVVKSLFATKLTGEAEAVVAENNQQVKKLSVNTYTFADKEATLNKPQSESTEKDAELKQVSSRVVDRLADRLGQKLCGYFN